MHDFKKPRFLIIELMLRSNVLFPLMPRRAPAVLSEMARRGDAGMHRVFRGARKSFRKTPLKTDGAQDRRGIGVSFLLDTFLWTSKEK